MVNLDSLDIKIIGFKLLTRWVRWLNYYNLIANVNKMTIFLKEQPKGLNYFLLKNMKKFFLLLKVKECNKL